MDVQMQGPACILCLELNGRLSISVVGELDHAHGPGRRIQDNSEE